MDNMASHKTKRTLSIIQQMMAPVLFTAPASFIAVPIEGIFEIIKSFEFCERSLREPTLVREIPADKFTKKQYLLAQLSEHLLNLEKETFMNVFSKRFKQLS